MRKKASLFTAMAFALISSVTLACDRPPMPELPDPASAVTPQMIKAKNDVKTFLAAAEVYLKCNITTKQHNAMVDEMHSIAENFNKVVRAYKDRMAG
jgi:hypothetical protein